jgi:hypothetical protein
LLDTVLKRNLGDHFGEARNKSGQGSKDRPPNCHIGRAKIKPGFSWVFWRSEPLVYDRDDEKRE